MERAVLGWVETWRRLTALPLPWRRAQPDDRGVLRISGDVLEAVDGQEVVVFRLDRASILAVEFFKRDMITVDDVCCDIYVEGGDCWRIDEELPGWDDAVEWLEALPGFRKNWRDDVIKPAFAECREVVFDRRSSD
ncbi:hypothetical protein [uncultured Phenylobacterium sp.]|uniref:hypothetical protein n=1 Tax=uncultured Phenylobacterium sp. TaxID=349273 RepID=UPI0025FD0821|nr:hypothetical protein [uncultured Phenylobacterium sp.]